MNKEYHGIPKHGICRIPKMKLKDGINLKEPTLIYSYLHNVL